ncbi:MAG: shikimate kinase [Bulleidia sp.]
MKLGLIGMPLGHSWSPAIHSFLINKPYDLIPLHEDELGPFLKDRNFDGLNVTIPYKQAVIPYLDELEESAERIGAVNCIVNRNGKLTGYNTDYEGFRDMLVCNGVEVRGKQAAVLGSGGASKAIREAILTLGGTPVIVSRNPKGEQISYEQLYEKQEKFSILVNTTPVGMSPDVDVSPVDPARFTNLSHVIDIVANPLCTTLCFQAKQLGIPCLGGFEMLVRQALAADRYFLDQDMNSDLIQPCINALLAERRNIVLIGMPTCGKSTISALLGEITGKHVVEMDEEITEKLGMPIRDWFETYGEQSFREKETETAVEHSTGKGEIISCGGGVIKTEATMRALSHNGIIIWIDRNLDYLYSTSDRPLASSIEQVRSLYVQRRPLYEKYSDITIQNNGTVEDCIEKIINVTGIRRK